VAQTLTLHREIAKPASGMRPDTVSALRCHRGWAVSMGAASRERNVPPRGGERRTARRRSFGVYVYRRCVHLGLSARLRVLVVIHCCRKGEDVIRLISARKANHLPRRQYVTRNA